MGLLEIAALAAGGAAIQEVLWWYGRRHKLDEARLKKLLRSRGYWLVTFCFIFASGLFGAAWFADDAGVTARTCLLIGATMPLLLKQGLSAAQPQQHLGSDEGFVLRDYLQ